MFLPARAIVSDYANIKELNEQGYGAKPKVEQMLASDLSPNTASSLKSPTLSTKPCRTTLSLVGKVAGQAKGCLQAYQANLLKDLDESEGVDPDAIQELDQATDLSLRSTKETARAISHSMEALVAMDRNL